MDRKKQIIGAAFAAALLVGSIVPAQAQNTWGNGRKWGSGANAAPRSNMRETGLLYNNDNIMPGQNRTQAMRLEAETGHINPQVDRAVKPMIKRGVKAPNPVSRVVRVGHGNR